MGNYFGHEVFIFADMSLKKGECRFEVPSASWFDLYSRNKQYIIITEAINNWLVTAKCVRSEVKVRCGNRPIIFLDGETFSHMGCILSGDSGLCFVNKRMGYGKSM